MKKLLGICVLLCGCASASRTVTAPALPACPAGYRAVGSHEAVSGPTAGMGFVIVPYTGANGKSMRLFCSADGSHQDPRISRPQ